MQEKEQSKSWHNRRGESARAFDLFQFYLSLAPEKRTYEQVCIQYGLSRAYIEKLAAKFLWIERSRNRNNFFAEQADEVSAAAVKDAEFDYNVWEEEKNIRFRVLTDGLLEKCEQMLAVPITQTSVQKIAVVDPNTGAKLLDKDGEIIYQTITTIKPGKWNATDTVRFAEAAVVLTKYLAEQNTKPNTRSPFPPPPKPLELMNMFERQAYIDDLREIQRQRAREDFTDDVIKLDDDGEQ
jgi:hypothetical protein